MVAGLGYYVLHAPDSVRAKAFYREVLGWHAEPGDDPAGYHHVEGSSPAGGIAGGASVARIDTSFMVADAKAVARQVRDLGGTAPEPTESVSGCSADCVDDQGGRFGIWQPSAGHAPDGPPKGGDGDLFYFVVPVADEDRAKRFYGTLFGWEFTPGSHPHGWNIANTEPPGGMFGAGTPGPIDSYFRVSDIEDALRRVREAGGTGGPAEPNSVGWHAACRDDQGLSFNLGSLRAS